MPKIHVYQPYGVTTTMRMKHRMRMPMVMRYRRERASASSRGARGSDVAEAGRLELFTVLPAYAAHDVRSPENRPAQTCAGRLDHRTGITSSCTCPDSPGGG